MRYYYKSTDGKSFLNLKTPPRNTAGYEEITQEEFEILTATPAPTAAQLAEAERLNQIASLKAQLAATDYQAIKYAEGVLTEEEYSPVKAQRQAWRDEINQLEGEIYEKINH